ncbi:kinesin-like protein KIN-7B isoform X2 [Chenopodium quinoa]|uniref:kinesin-like protein KIN-7B isoform X2 n=1 Tax=Chenopodium quinoa TaxID=63459 RepID=UPI000B78FBFC|nr:kinesin-like protein KIN-7B isoform X2 [Chenopodium quinoa]
MGEPKTPLSKILTTTSSCTPGGTKVREEKIMVMVRVRPLSSREQAMYDLIALECPDEETVVFKNPNDERPCSSFTFDKVFSSTCVTARVYEGGAKDVALSALTGINATIFAYGQTSSGKTFTMRGITEYAIEDIYQYMQNHPERNFSVKMSALEIYNETVVDLLNRSSGPLRLLDDPEKGTIVEKQVEEVVKDSQHLKHLIGICEAQRQVGETALNDKSSRSHQIVRLTIESRLKENAGRLKSFIASLNLVDLAGSERASQTKSAGLRLREGSHINRSLLTLTQVIRKLGGKRTGHIPYRESKLTRILQSSLGGNARTAIICTLSPALSHVEQSRNTLLFATSAKEVTNTTRVNVVVTDQQLVKHLQQEVSRLEAELKSPEPSSSSAALKALLIEKNVKIQKLERKMGELKRQRDLAQSQLELERTRKEKKESSNSSPSNQVRKCLAYPLDTIASKFASETQERYQAGRQSMLRQSVTSTDPSLLVQEIRKLEVLQRRLGDEANKALDILQKEVACNRLGTQDAAENVAKLLSEIKNMQIINSISEDIMVKDKADLKEEIIRLNSQGQTIESLEKKLENVQNSVDRLVFTLGNNEDTPDTKTQSKRKKGIPFNLTNSPNMSNFIRAPCSPLSSSRRVMDEIGNTMSDSQSALPTNDSLPNSCKSTPLKGDQVGYSHSSRENTPARQKSNSVNVKKMKKMFNNTLEETARNIRSYVTELKERVAKLQYQKQLLVCQVLDLEAGEATTSSHGEPDQSPFSWLSMFEEQRKQIVMLWHLCHVSLVHRTQFFLLFRGDPADQIYMEVELRRLTWLEQHLSDLGNASPALLSDEPASYVSSSIKALKQERENLAKRVSSRLTPEEREALYRKWDIPPEGKQRRRLQLVNKLWTDPHSLQHVQESADIVAKLVGFCESGEQLKREMFELNFKSPCDKKTWMGWNLISNLLHL